MRTRLLCSTQDLQSFIVNNRFCIVHVYCETPMDSMSTSCDIPIGEIKRNIIEHQLPEDTEFPSLILYVNQKEVSIVPTQMLESRQKRLSLLGEKKFSPTALGPRTTDPLGLNKPKIYSP